MEQSSSSPNQSSYNLRKRKQREAIQNPMFTFHSPQVSQSSEQPNTSAVVSPVSETQPQPHSTADYSTLVQDDREAVLQDALNGSLDDTVFQIPAWARYFPEHAHEPLCVMRQQTLRKLLKQTSVLRNHLATLENGARP